MSEAAPITPEEPLFVIKVSDRLKKAAPKNPERPKVTMLIPQRQRDAIKSLKFHLDRLPEDAPSLAMPSAIDAWRVMRESDAATYLSLLTLVRRADRVAAGIIEERASRPAAGTVQGQDGGITVLDASEFLGDFRPPEDLLEGYLRRTYAYALTSPTNGGKTALCVHATVRFGLGLTIAGIKVSETPVLYLAGENPYDVKPRMIAECQALGVDWRELTGKVKIVPAAFPLYPNVEHIRDLVRGFEFGVAFVDTSMAYYHGQEVNDNVAQRDHALSLREITTFAGDPTVVGPAHPIKSAGREGLEPMGGSAFLNELDGNLTCWNEGDVVTLGWYKKLRQPPFDPIQFALRRVELAGIKYRDGRPYVTVALQHISEQEAEQMHEHAEQIENRILYAMLRHPNEGLRGWAASANVPFGSIYRHLRKLAEDKMVKKHRNH